jgi:hypothetical protein
LQRYCGGTRKCYRGFGAASKFFRSGSGKRNGAGSLPSYGKSATLRDVVKDSVNRSVPGVDAAGGPDY